MTEADTAWAAGLFEGEGCFMTRRGKYAMLVMRMRDRDVVERFAAIVGCGAVTLQDRSSFNDAHSDMWVWQVAKRADCKRVAEMFLPYLGERRAERARDVIEAASLVDGRTLRFSKP